MSKKGKTKIYKCDFEIDLRVRMEYEAESDEKAQEFFESHRQCGAEHLIAYGVASETVEMDFWETQLPQRLRR